MQLKIAHIMVNGVLISVQVSEEQYEQLADSDALYDPSTDIESADPSASANAGEALESSAVEDEPKLGREKNEPESAEA